MKHTRNKKEISFSLKVVVLSVLSLVLLYVFISSDQKEIVVKETSTVEIGNVKPPTKDETGDKKPPTKDETGDKKPPTKDETGNGFSLLTFLTTFIISLLLILYLLTPERLHRNLYKTLHEYFLRLRGNNNDKLPSHDEEMDLLISKGRAKISKLQDKIEELHSRLQLSDEKIIELNDNIHKLKNKEDSSLFFLLLRFQSISFSFLNKDPILDILGDKVIEKNDINLFLCTYSMSKDRNLYYELLNKLHEQIFIGDKYGDICDTVKDVGKHVIQNLKCAGLEGERLFEALGKVSSQLNKVSNSKFRTFVPEYKGLLDQSKMISNSSVQMRGNEIESITYWGVYDSEREIVCKCEVILGEL